MRELSAEELIDRSAAAAERLRRLVDLGIILYTAARADRAPGRST